MTWLLLALALLALLSLILLGLVAVDSRMVEPKRRRREENARLLLRYAARFNKRLVAINANFISFAEAAQRTQRSMRAFQARFENFKIPE